MVLKGNVVFCNKMLRIIYKALFVLVLLWILSIMIKVKKFKYANVAVIDDERSVFDELRHELANYSEVKIRKSSFKVWRILPSVKNKMSRNEILAVINNPDHPPGVNGKPVILKENLKLHIREEVKKGWLEHAFNSFVSDLIPVNRSLLDVRDKRCRTRIFSKDLPKASVIICFHNEALSTLLRTLHSVLNRSPAILLEEIILVDDASTKIYLQKKLEIYIKEIQKVKLIRNMDREGIIRSRIIGTKKARAPVVVFLDSHCECMEGWLEPLLEQISQNSTKVVSPVVDQIHESTFEYLYENNYDLRIGGFNWDLKFTWISIPNEVIAERKYDVEPLKTPTISGGLFAINKNFFETLGYYDEAFDIWGAENLEISFKAWMCGGSLEIIPCSHVGHLFRNRFPYEGILGSETRNNVRLAEVWLDDYAKYFYERIGNTKGNFDNVSQRNNLRRKLNCKSFKWYLGNVYPQLIIPDNNIASGQIKSQNYDNWCIDASARLTAIRINVNLFPCHNQGGNQFWYYTRAGEIRRDDMCMDYLIHSVMMYPCRGTRNAISQIWLYEEQRNKIKHKKTRKCLATTKIGENNYKVVLQTCIEDAPNQWWIMDNYKTDRLSFVK